MPEKLETCPDCGKQLRQGEYDLQCCETCGTAMFFRRPHQSVVAEISAERRRQILDEKWTPAHDDRHYHDGELARAAACYAYVAALPVRIRRYVSGIYSIRNNAILEDLWPFSPGWWKPKEPRRDMIRAAALLVAAIEQLDRAAADPVNLSGSGPVPIEPREADHG